MDCFAFFAETVRSVVQARKTYAEREFNETTTFYSVFVSRDNNRNNENTGRGGNR